MEAAADLAAWEGYGAPVRPRLDGALTPDVVWRRDTQLEGTHDGPTPGSWCAWDIGKGARVEEGVLSRVRTSRHVEDLRRAPRRVARSATRLVICQGGGGALQERMRATRAASCPLLPLLPPPLLAGCLRWPSKSCRAGRGRVGGGPTGAPFCSAGTIDNGDAARQPGWWWVTWHGS